MIKLSLKNIESVLFKNSKLRGIFPEFNHYFDQWKLAKHHSFLKSLGIQAMIDLINNLNDTHLKKIEEFYNLKVEVVKVANKLIDNYEFNLANLENELDQIPINCNISVYRNKEKLFITSYN